MTWCWGSRDLNLVNIPQCVTDSVWHLRFDFSLDVTDNGCQFSSCEGTRRRALPEVQVLQHGEAGTLRRIVHEKFGRRSPGADRLRLNGMFMLLLHTSHLPCSGNFQWKLVFKWRHSFCGWRIRGVRSLFQQCIKLSSDVVHKWRHIWGMIYVTLFVT